MEFIPLPNALLSASLENAREVSFQMPALDEMMDQVPCANPDGSIGAMPTREEVLSWFNDVVFINNQPVNTWYGYALANAILPVSWADPLTTEQQNFLDWAVRLLSSKLFQLAVHHLKNRQTVFPYPRSWGERAPRGERRLRVPWERLFDRLHINCTFTDGAAVLRRDWYDSNNGIQSLPTTYFGVAPNYSSHPYIRLRRYLAKEALGSALNEFVGAASVPENFVLPLEWSEAIYSGVSMDLEFKIPSELRGTLRNIVDAINPDSGEARDFNSTQSKIYWAFLVARFLGFERNQFAENVERAVEADYANDTIAEIMNAIGAADWDNLYAGIVGLVASRSDAVLEGIGPDLSNDEWFTLQRMFSSASVVDGMERPFPTILLGESFVTYAERFSGFSHGWGPEGGAAWMAGVVNSQRRAYEAWHEWWSKVQPSKDVAYVFDMTAMVLKQLIHTDDAVVALSELVGMEGVLAHVLRSALFEKRLFHLFDALGGASPVEIISFYVRQFLTDSFFVAHPAVDPLCLYPVFCWMDNPSKRDAIDAALGQPAALGMDGLVVAYRFGGALQSIVQSIQSAVGDSDDGTVDFVKILREQISESDALALRTWVLGAKLSCLKDVTVRRMEPNWTYSRGVAPDSFDPELEEAESYERKDVL